MNKSLFVISERKEKNELIASELNSFEKVRMRIYIGGWMAWDGEDEGGRQKH